MEQAVGRDDVVERLGTTLRVDGAAHVGEVAQQVKAVEQQRGLHHHLAQLHFDLLRHTAMIAFFIVLFINY